MKKIIVTILFALVVFPAVACSGVVSLEQYSKTLLEIKRQELMQLQRGEKNVGSYAIFGTNPPPFLLSGDDFVDQLLSTKSRITIIKMEIASLESVVSQIGGSTSTSMDDALPPVADSHVYAYSYRGWNTANWGRYEVLGAGWNPTGGEKRTYLKFDVSGIEKASFKKATLKLYHYHSAGSDRVKLGVYTVRSPWNEGNGTYKPSNVAAPEEICWINQPQFDPYPVASFNPGMQTSDFVEVDITSLVGSWVNGMENHGLVIKAVAGYATGSESMYGFLAREHVNIEGRPQLIINDGVQQPIVATPQSTISPSSPTHTVTAANNVSGAWSVSQSNGYTGKLILHQNSGGQLTGNITWHTNLQGTIAGFVSGKSVGFTVQYSWGKGSYKGTLSADKTQIVNGSTTSSTGEHATWSAKIIEDATSNTSDSRYEHDIDRPGADLRSFTLEVAAPSACERACLEDSRCRAWTYVRPHTIQGPNPRCWLKHSVPGPRKSSCCISGVIGGR